MKRCFSILLIFIPVGIFLSLNCAHSLEKRAPKLKWGVLDLRGWEFERDGFIHLSGQSEFYWNRLYTPGNFQSGKVDRDYIKIPQSWNRHLEDYFANQGFATYRFKILVDPGKTSFAFKMPLTGSAYNLFVDGKLLASNGVVGKTAETAVPEWRPQIVEFPIMDNQVEVIIQVSNYHFMRGGIWKKVYFGTAKQLKQYKEKRQISDFLLIGAILIIGLYHLCISFYRKDKSFLFFGLLCLFIAIRIPFISERYILQLFPDLSWEVLLKISHSIIYFISTFLALCVCEFFSKEIPKKVSYITTAIALSFTIFTVSTPSEIHSWFHVVFQCLAICIFLYLWHPLILSLKRKREGSIAYLASWSAITITALNDVFYDNEIIKTGYYLSFGLLIFIFFQSILLSKRFSNALDKAEKLSKKLKAQSKELEKKNEKLLQIDKLKDEFLANTSHELRTPLHGIVGIAETLRDDIANGVIDKSGNDLELIIQDGKRLSNLVNDILDFSNLNQGHPVLQLKTVDVRQLIHTILGLHTPFLQSKRLSFKTAIDEKLPFAEADENRLQQVINNLLGNAIKFSDAETVIKISASREKNKLKISISDTGAGIPRDRYDLIFEPFTQGDGSVTRKYEGAGLGLSIAKKLVNLQGGKLTFESIEGVGTTFHFTIPIASNQEKKPESAFDDTEQSKRLSSEFDLKQKEIFETLNNSVTEHNACLPKLAQPEILIVDDDISNLQLLFNQLKNSNYKLKLVHTGELALEYVETSTPDLVLLDLIMPRISGYDVCKKIRDKFNKNTLPVIILTARNQIEDVRKSLHFANDFLSKPFRKEELIARVNNLLEIKYAGMHSKENKRLNALVSEKQKNEKQLKKERQRFQQILDQINEAVISLNDQQKITFFNHQAELMFDYDQAEVLGKKISRFLPAVDQKLKDLVNHENPEQELRLWNESSAPIAGITSKQKEFEINSSISFLNLKEGKELSITLSPQYNQIHNDYKENKTVPKVSKKGSGNEIFLKNLVSLMNLSLSYWEESTGKDRMDFVTESKIWKYEKFANRSKTFDRYFSIKTIPKQYPLWENVKKTAEYVLKNSSISSELRAQTENKLNELLNNIKELKLKPHSN